MDTLSQLLVRKFKTEERIESLKYHITNLSFIGGEGRLMLAGQFKEKVEKLEQRLAEVGIAIENCAD